MSKFIDLSKLPTYTPTYDTENYTEVYGYKVLLPDEPADEFCINFGLPKEEQDVNFILPGDAKEPVYKRVLIPDDLGYWEPEVMEVFIEAEYHRRKHGIWILIKGQKYYITGVFYFFLNYWVLQTGKRPAFRMSDMEFFLIWMHVVVTPSIFGLLILKCRRTGDTEKGLCIIYEYASRVKNTDNMMQDCRTEDDIFKTYLRLTFAHEKMTWFMKPINRGTSNPKAALEFKFPEKHNTVKSLKNSKDVKVDSLGDADFEYEALGSTINYYPSKAEASDGKRHGRALVEEWGKAQRMQFKDAWVFMKQTLVDQILGVLCGKCVAPTTVEDIKGGENVAVVQQTWDEADPENVSSDGETINGLIRIFRGALERGKADRYGFTDKEAAAKKIEEDSKRYVQAKNFKGLLSYRRQNCITIDDVFTTIEENSGFNTENLAQRRHRLQYEIEPRKWVRGNFMWKDNKRDTTVIWVPCSNGRWYCAGKPSDWGLKDNAKPENAIIPRPGNTWAFASGLDPYAQKDVLETNPSKGAIVVKRKLDNTIDGDKYDDEGNPLYGGENFRTNRYVCAYMHRHEDPKDFYEDAIMTLVYWGCETLAEKQHFSALQTYMELRRYEKYLMDTSAGQRNYKKQVERGGISANEKSIDNYFSLLTTLSHSWWNTIDIPLIIEQLISMNWENRGKKDVGVAAGLCEIAALKDNPKPKEVLTEDEGEMYFDEQFV